MPEIKEWKTIKFTTQYFVENEKGEKIISFVSQDGVNYDFIEIPETKEYTKIPYVPTLYKENMSHEFDRAHKIKHYILQYFIVR